MNTDQALKIVSECTAHTWFMMGLRKEPPTDISKYSLSEIIEANEVVNKYNDERTDRFANLVMDDRYIAAIYTLSHYPSKNGEAVVIDGHKALLVIPLPEDYFTEGED